MHGNGQKHDGFLGYRTLKTIVEGDRLFAIIDGQDFVAPPFQSTASGWGNSEYRARYVSLYNYLVETYHIAPDIDIIGASMGGIAMGRFIANKTIPIRRAYGLGPVPSIQSVFDAGGERRKQSIRNAFGMATDGADDWQLHRFAQDAFWTEDLVGNVKLPDLRIMVGTGDRTFAVEFGGERAFSKLCETYNLAGGVCSYMLVDGVGHAGRTMLATIIDPNNK